MNLFMILFMLGIGLVLFALWIASLVHAIRNRGLTDGERIVWVIVIVFLHLLGTILYWFVGRPKQPATA
jgi:hypothetical protein